MARPSTFHHHRPLRHIAAIALATGLALTAACGEDEPASRNGAASRTDAPAAAPHFPVVLDADVRTTASADGSRITQTPLTPSDRRRTVAGAVGAVAPDGRRTVIYRDGVLLLDEGGVETEIARIPGAPEYASLLWSPDGRQVAIAASDDGTAGLYIVNADGSGITDVGQGIDDRGYFDGWSPDSRRVMFRVFPREGEVTPLYVIGADGSGPILAGEVVSPQGDGGWDGPTWSPDGTHIVALSPVGVGVRILDAAGVAPPVDIPAGERFVVKFSWSADSRSVAFDRGDGRGDSAVLIADAGGAVAPRVLAEGFWPRWSPAGDRIAFKRNEPGGGKVDRTGVFTVRPDGTGLAELGEVGPTYFNELTWAPDGATLSFDRDASGVRQLYTVNIRTGETSRAPRSLTEAGYHEGFRSLALARDGARLAFVLQGPVEGGAPDDIRLLGWAIMEIATGDVTQTNLPSDGAVFWDGDTLRAAYVRRGEGVYVAATDGSPPRIVGDAGAARGIAWSADGRRIAVSDGPDFRIIALDGSAERTIAAGLEPDVYYADAVRWSPDGARIMYTVSRPRPDGIFEQETRIVDLGAGESSVLIPANQRITDARWGPDGSIAFTRSAGSAVDSSSPVWVRGPDGAQRMLATFPYDQLLYWSPDGSKLAAVPSPFISADVHIIDLATGEATLVATVVGNCGITFAGWAPDNATIYLIPACALGGV